MKKVIFGLAVLLYSVPVWGDIGPDEAALMTGDLEETQLFYRLIGQQECIEFSVEAPCDSGWVTCIDEAWVVRYFLKEECPPVHEQVSVTFVVDAKEGKIISRYPEKEYFEDSRFCREAFDCFDVPEEGCRNFLHARREEGAMPGCACREQQCVPGVE